MPFRAGSTRERTACSPSTAQRCTRPCTASSAVSGSHASCGVSDNNRKAKFYTLTAAGRTQLRAESTDWKTYAEAVFKVLRPS